MLASYEKCLCFSSFDNLRIFNFIDTEVTNFLLGATVESQHIISIDSLVKKL